MARCPGRVETKALFELDTKCVVFSAEEKVCHFFNRMYQVATISDEGNRTNETTSEARYTAG